MKMNEPVTQLDIDQRVFDLYDEYCHGHIDRREFLARSAAVCAAGLVMGAEIQAGVPYYGAAAATAEVPKIKAPLLVQLAENDASINAMWPACEAAARLSWERTVAHFRKHLA